MYTNSTAIVFQYVRGHSFAGLSQTSIYIFVFLFEKLLLVVDALKYLVDICSHRRSEHLNQIFIW